MSIFNRFQSKPFTKIDNANKVALITFFSSLYLYSHVGTLYLQERGLNLLQVSSITSIITASIFIAEVPTGVIADKIGRKYSVVMAMAFQVLGEVLYLFLRNYWGFALLAVIAGVGFAFQSGCLEALIYDSLPEDERELRMKKAMGRKGLAYQLAFFLAPILGGFLVPQFTVDRFLLAVLITACSVFVALLIALTLEELPTSYKHVEQSSWDILKEGITQIQHNRTLKWLMLITILTATFAGSLVNLYQPYFIQFEISAFWMGMAFAIGALLAGVGEQYVYKIESLLGPRWGIFSVTIVPGLFYVALSLANSATFAFVLFITTYSTTTLKNPLMSAYQNQLIESSNRATVLSLMNLISSLYLALMILAVGWLADWSLSYAFLAMGGVIVLATVVLRVDRVGGTVQTAPNG